MTKLPPKVATSAKPKQQVSHQIRKALIKRWPNYTIKVSHSTAAWCGGIIDVRFIGDLDVNDLPYADVVMETLRDLVPANNQISVAPSIVRLVQ